MASARTSLNKVQIKGQSDWNKFVRQSRRDLSKALGLDFDGSGIGFGTRAQRFALVADDGVVTTLAVEKPMQFEVSSAEAVLASL